MEITTSLIEKRRDAIEKVREIMMAHGHHPNAHERAIEESYITGEITLDELKKFRASYLS